MEIAAQEARELGERIRTLRQTQASRLRMEKELSADVRQTVIRSTRLLTQASDILEIAIAIATSAAHAAPEQRELITRAIVFAGPVARLDGAMTRIRAATFATTRGTPALAPLPGPGSPDRSQVLTAGNPRSASVRTQASRDLEDLTALAASQPRSNPLLPGRESWRVSTSATVQVSHDSNIFLRPSDEVDETIVSVIPGVSVRVGNNSRAHASASYQVAFTEYLNDAAASAQLGTGTLAAGYEDAKVSVRASANYQQVDENSRDISQIAGDALIRRENLDAELIGESKLTAKTSVQGGASLNLTKYKRAGLVGTRNLTVPVSIFVETAPKFALSTGVTHSRVEAQGGGPEARDWFFSLGLRGSLTARITANFSAGYRTRELGGESDGMWGFDGSFNYAATPKTSGALLLSRDFSSSALGDSLTDTSYFVTLSSTPSLQWQFSAAVGQRQVNYGRRLFTIGATEFNVGREDSYWEGNLNATYLINRLATASAGWTHRRNYSNAPSAEFASNLVSLSLLFQY